MDQKGNREASAVTAEVKVTRPSKNQTTRDELLHRGNTLETMVTGVASGGGHHIGKRETTDPKVSTTGQLSRCGFICFMRLQKRETGGKADWEQNDDFSAGAMKSYRPWAPWLFNGNRL